MRTLGVDYGAHAKNNPPMNYGDIGRRVRVWRAEKGWTQEKLADEAKVGLGTVQALEDAPNRERPRQTQTEKLEQVAKALGRTLDELIKGKREAPQIDPILSDEDLDIATMFHHARTSRRTLVDALLRARIDHRIVEAVVKLAGADRSQQEAALRLISNVRQATETERATSISSDTKSEISQKGPREK